MIPMIRPLTVMVCAALLSVSLLPMAGVRAATSALRVVTQVPLPATHEAGMAVLGTRYAYVGTTFDQNNTVYVYDLHAHRVVARWHLPVLRGPNAIVRSYTMDSMVMSPDGRWLYIYNRMRDDVVVVDVTGHAQPRALSMGDIVPDFIAVAGRYLYLTGVPSSGGASQTTIFDAASGSLVGTLQPSMAVAAASDGSIYSLSTSFNASTGTGQAAVRVYRGPGGSGRVLASFSGRSPTPPTAAMALSPDGRRVYVLWNGFRAFDARSGRALGLVPLPSAPHYTGVAIAPNGRQAILWAPDFTGWFETPSADPGYIVEHFGFVAGSLVPIDLRSLRPLIAHLPRVTAPQAVAYTSDSRQIVVSQPQELDVLSSGVSGSGAGPVGPVGPGATPPPATPVAQPRITVTRAGLYHVVNGTAQWTTTLHARETGDFIAYYRTANAGGAVPSAQLTISSGGRTIDRVAMTPGTTTNGVAYVRAQASFTGSGSGVAHITLHLGPARVTRAVSFTVVA